MVIDRPHFYFTANKIKRFISFAILMLFLLAIVASIIPDNPLAFRIGVFSFTLIFILIITYLILWIIT